MSLDVLLLTPEEAQANFVNHNPLFLDMAEDGVVLLDRAGTLAEAIQETRHYVRERGIARIRQGWRFPVEQGVATFLSKVTNRDFARGMMRDAERDSRIGERLLEAAFYDKAVYHFQQAVEKGVKVGEILRGVAEEPQVPERWKGPLREAAGLSEELEPEVTLSRYPGIVNDALWLPSEEYTVEDADAAKVKALKALATLREFVEAWFAQPPQSTG
jgi:HEPN domain-containing protein